jgi:hypothetical protein
VERNWVETIPPIPTSPRCEEGYNCKEAIMPRKWSNWRYHRVCSSVWSPNSTAVTSKYSRDGGDNKLHCCPVGYRVSCKILRGNNFLLAFRLSQLQAARNSIAPAPRDWVALLVNIAWNRTVSRLYKFIVWQRPQHTRGQQYWCSVFIASAVMSYSSR